MSKAIRTWAGRVAALSVAVVTTAAAVAVLPAGDGGRSGQITVSAASLARFYPTRLASSPIGTIEDEAIWIAKVQGLMAAAPPLLQQSLLMSQTTQEFVSNLALLEQMQEGMLKRGALELQSQARNGLLTTKALGDASNLIYTPLEPCRIMDTRNATLASGVQGPITGGSLKQIPGFITTGSNWSQYGQTGTPSDCRLTNPPGAAIHAVALVITILNPNFDAFLGVGDNNNLATALSTVALNYTHGQGLSTMYIVPQVASNFIYFALPAGLSAQLIFDVVGYYSVSDATALDCVWTAQATVDLTANMSSTVSSALCAPGYSLTGGTCYLSTPDATLVDSGSGTFFNSSVWYCFGRAGPTVSSITSFGRCCRVPGK